MGCRYSETIIFGIRRDFTHDRSSRQVFLKKGLLACNFIKKRFQFPAKFARFLRTPFLRKTFGGCFYYDSETCDMMKLYLSLYLYFSWLYLISFCYKLYMILINLVNVNHLIYYVQEKPP